MVLINAAIRMRKKTPPVGRRASRKLELKGVRRGDGVAARRESESDACAGGVFATELTNPGHTHRHSGDAGID